MVIKTERLLLINYCNDDLNNFHKLKSNDSVWKYSSKVASTSIGESKQFLDNILKNYNSNTCDFQALFLKDRKEYIGEAGVLSFNKKSNRAVIGYNLLPYFWGKGYGTEITKALLEYLFMEEKVERIEALVQEDNKASKRVLEKTGFIMEGLLRNFTYINKKYVNVCYYGIIREDLNYQ